MRLISAPDIIGAVSYWAVRQHPYRRPEGLFEVVDGLWVMASTWNDGAPSMPMKWFPDYQAVKVWLSDTLACEPMAGIMMKWNEPRSGHKAPFVAVSRHGGPHREDDFIDIDALIMNVARSAWDDAAEFERAA